MPLKPTRPTQKRPAAKQPPAKTHGPLLDNALMHDIIETLDATYTHHPMDESTGGHPYKVLVGCIISLRTKDEVTIPACERLFPLADTPKKMIALDLETIEKAIYPAGFYKTKAKTIQEASRVLLEQHQGQVPDTIEALLTLKGVGRKTANLVVGLGHRLPAICVDIHVHRICNRLGYIATQTPDESEMALRAKLPERFWHIINRVMVLHGRDCCKAIGPRCDVCPVEGHCQKIDVKPRKLKPATATTKSL
ncbi:MAG: endonuclease III [Vampirovibrionales bacterium]|nr:endonuclease III [Vampirovibrionales bacterium]